MVSKAKRQGALKWQKEKEYYQDEEMARMEAKERVKVRVKAKQMIHYNLVLFVGIPYHDYSFLYEINK